MIIYTLTNLAYDYNYDAKGQLYLTFGLDKCRVDDEQYYIVEAHKWYFVKWFDSMNQGLIVHDPAKDLGWLPKKLMDHYLELRTPYDR